MCTICSMTSTFDPSRHPEGAPLEATIVEIGDAAADISTVYAMQVGDVFSGKLDWVSDRDWVAVTLDAGTNYSVTLQGTGGGGGTLSDPYLRIYDANGAMVTFDDDGGPVRDSALSFGAPTSGTYYISAAAWNDSTSGTYEASIVASPPPEVGTLDEMADYLTDGFWQDDGRSGFSFDTSFSNQITVNITGLTTEGAQLARWAFEAWEMVADLDFVETASSSAMIMMDDEDTGAYASSVTSGSMILSSEINVGLDWLSYYGTTIDSYSFQTYMHELGHALGLGHQGSYNGAASYGIDETFSNDSWQLSLMSYFSQPQNTSTNASYGLTMTAMMVDIIAMQNLYGAPGAASATGGDTTWGNGSTLPGYLSDYFDYQSGGSGGGNVVGDPTVLTIYDQGGTDTLDLSFSVTDDRIDLTPEAFSDILGRIGSMGIARGTIIENAIGGSGADEIVGNTAANDIEGRNGNDRLFGDTDNDTLSGGDGFDFIRGGSDNDLIHGGALADNLGGDNGNDTIHGGQGIDQLYGGFGDDYLDGGNDDDLILGQIGHDRMFGNNGDDRLFGAHGFDYIRGGNDDDLIDGGTLADNLGGDNGNDTIHGEQGIDQLYGGFGDDYLDGGNDDDLILGQIGHDRMFGGNGDDRLFGAHGFDYIRGGNDDDLIDGGTLADNLGGDNGNDTLIGDQGIDVLYGGFGDDVLDGGADDDRLFGQIGSDTFVFANGHGDDTVKDFNADSPWEKLDFSALSSINTMSQLNAAAVDTAEGVLITTSANSSILLEGVTEAQLDTSDFIFV